MVASVMAAVVCILRNSIFVLTIRRTVMNKTSSSGGQNIIECLERGKRVVYRLLFSTLGCVYIYGVWRFYGFWD